MADKIKFYDLCETLLPKVKGKKRVALVTFMESDLMNGEKDKDGKLVEEESGIIPPMADLPVEAPAADADPAEALWDGFRTAMIAIIDSEDDAAAKLEKLKQYLEAHENLDSGGEAPAKTEPVEEAVTTESRNQSAIALELQRYKNREKVVELAESLGCTGGKALSQTMLDGIAEMSESRWRPVILDMVKTTRGPRSAGPNVLPMNKEPQAAKDTADFLSKIVG